MHDPRLGLRLNGMLQRNGLITDEDAERLEQWVEAIEWMVTMLLGSADGVPLHKVVDEGLATYLQVAGRDYPPEI